MASVRLIVVTDRARMAAISVFGGDVPNWARVIDDPLDILSIRDGSKCLGRWFGPRTPRSPAEQAWLERRLMGGLEFMSDDDWTRFFTWRDGGEEKATIPTDLPAPSTPEKPLLLQQWT